MLKRPEINRDALTNGGLSLKSAHEWCLFFAEEAVFNGGDPAYWMAKAEGFDPSLIGFVWSQELEQEVLKYVTTDAETEVVKS